MVSSFGSGPFEASAWRLYDTHGTRPRRGFRDVDRRLAQSPDIDTPLLAAPANMREGTTVIKWKADFTYDTLKKGTNRLVCYDRSGQPGQQPFALECTSIANLDRVAQNMKFEAGRQGQGALEAAEKDGTRVKPEFGSVWYTWAARTRSKRART